VEPEAVAALERDATVDGGLLPSVLLAAAEGDERRAQRGDQQGVEGVGGVVGEGREVRLGRGFLDGGGWGGGRRGWRRERDAAGAMRSSWAFQLQPSGSTKASRAPGRGTGSSTTKGASVTTVVAPVETWMRTACVLPSTSFSARTWSGPAHRGE